MRPIDADELLNALQNFFDKREKDQIFSGSRDANVSWNDAICFIKSASTVDAVPVVFCEKCEHQDRKWKPYEADENQYFCPMIGLVTNADFFCKDGERKGGDE